MRDAAALLATLALVAACGPSVKEQARREMQHFSCKERSVSYMVAHHMAGDEIGALLDCAEAGPRIKRWKTLKGGTRLEDARGMTPAEFDEIWRQVDGTGWQYLKDCTNGTGGKQDPVYVFDVKDDHAKASFSCQSQTAPFPYNAFVDPLDAAAQKGGKQLGDDEPADLKALDAKKKKPR